MSLLLRSEFIVYHMKRMILRMEMIAMKLVTNPLFVVDPMAALVAIVVGMMHK